jgi:hypothetical protein
LKPQKVNFNPNDAIGIISQHPEFSGFFNHTSPFGLFWIEGIASYFEIQNVVNARFDLMRHFAKGCIY